MNFLSYSLLLMTLTVPQVFYRMSFYWHLADVFLAIRLGSGVWRGRPCGWNAIIISLYRASILSAWTKIGAKGVFIALWVSFLWGSHSWQSEEIMSPTLITHYHMNSWIRSASSSYLYPPTLTDQICFLPSAINLLNYSFPLYMFLAIQSHIDLLWCLLPDIL